MNDHCDFNNRTCKKIIKAPTYRSNTPFEKRTVAETMRLYPDAFSKLNQRDIAENLSSGIIFNTCATCKRRTNNLLKDYL